MVMMPLSRPMERDLEREIKAIDLLKVDIEGAELELFENFSIEFLEKIRQVTIEFHDHLNIGDIPRIKSIIKKMKKNGFYVLNFSHFTYGDIMMINKKHEIERGVPDKEPHSGGWARETASSTPRAVWELPSGDICHDPDEYKARERERETL